MGQLFRCSCGTAYNLETGKKYKCKKCGAIMALPAPEDRIPATAATPPTRSGRPSQIPGRASSPARSSGSRPSLRSSRLANRAEPEAKKSSTGLFIGIGVGAAALLSGLFMLMSGGDDSTEKAKGANNAAKAAPVVEKVVEKPPPPPKKLTPEELNEMRATIQKGADTRDEKLLLDLLDKMKAENWDVDKEMLYKALLVVNPKHPRVTAAVGLFQRKKWTYDVAEAKAKLALKDKEPRKALYDVVVWVFESEIDREIDWLYVVYKKIRDNFPDDYEAKVAWFEKPQREGSEPYTGPVQEYRGKKLRKDEFEDVKRLEWKLHKETGIPFVPTMGGGSQPQ